MDPQIGIGPTGKERNEGRLLGFFATNPIVGVISTISSLASVPLALFFYYHSPVHRELTYLVSSSKAVVVKTGQTSRLSVLLDGKVFSRDVTAVQIAFWNNGSEAIRRENVLEAFVINVATPIIDATIRKTTRKTAGISLDKTHIGSGRLGILWNILEQHDGGIIQVTLEGTPETSVTGTAVIEGQRRVVEEKKWDISARLSGFKLKQPVQRFFGWVYICGSVLVVFWVGGRLRRVWQEGNLTVGIAIALGVQPIALALIGVFALMSLSPEPPFGF